jgi:hypothetical protein
MLRGDLNALHGSFLEPQVCLIVLRNLANEAPERSTTQKMLGALLVATNLT